MIMKKIIVFFVLSIVLFMVSNDAALGNDWINLSMNCCQFRFNQDTSLVEVYYGITRESDDTLSQNITPGPLLLSITISSDNAVVLKNMWQLQNQTEQNLNSPSHRYLVDVLRFLLVPGTYNFKLIAKDLSSVDLIDSIEVKQVEVKKHESKKLQLSDIQLAQNISAADPVKKDRFTKNRYQVTPNPINLFDKENNQVYYYLELYNLHHVREKFYYLKRTVFDNNGLPLALLPIYSKKKMLHGNDAVEVGMFDVSQFPSGKYYIQLAVLDSAESELITTQNSFFVYNPDVLPPDLASLPVEQQMLSSEIAVLSDNDVETLLEVTRYFLTDEEKRIIAGLETLSAKQVFLYRYWRDHDEQKETPVLESLRTIMNRVRHANQKFRHSTIDGWKSDRGRVLIIYGEPSDIQYYPNRPEFKEFQSWNYDQIENGVSFIFGTTGGFGDLRLIHSTKTGEIHNDFWFDMIKVTEGITGLSELSTRGADTRENLRKTFQRYNLEFPRYLK